MDAFATHLETTIRCGLECLCRWPDLPLLELGCGEYSTPVLAALARQYKSRLDVVSTDAQWLERFAFLDSPALVRTHITSWSEFTAGKSYSLVLLDNEQRVRDRVTLAEELASSTRVLVLHDACRVTRPNITWDSLSDRYRYIHIRRRLRPTTAVLSNYVDPASWDL